MSIKRSNHPSWADVYSLFQQSIGSKFVIPVYQRDYVWTDLQIKQSESKYGFEILNQDNIQYSKSLDEAIKRNESAKHRIIWLTIETRPDLVIHENCKFWRELWVTRVEMWIQSTDDEILALNKRWHTVEQIKTAMHIMRQYGFKISIHLMPGLYGSNLEKDIQSFKTVFSDPAFQPDELKFYPTSVIPNTPLYDLYREWKYTPISTDWILEVIRETFLNVIPPYTRIKRLIRDIPATEIVAWSNVTNLSQIAHEKLLKEKDEEQQRLLKEKDDENFRQRTEFQEKQSLSIVGYVKNVVKTLNCTVMDAFNILNLNDEERMTVLKMLEH